eukprot:230664-Amphidinium_carterae.2
METLESLCHASIESHLRLNHARLKAYDQLRSEVLMLLPICWPKRPTLALHSEHLKQQLGLRLTTRWIQTQCIRKVRAKNGGKGEKGKNKGQKQGGKGKTGLHHLGKANAKDNKKKEDGIHTLL